MVSRADPPMPPQPERVQRLLADLKPHPRQDEVFDALEGAEFEDFVQSIKTNGLRHPIDITPDNITLSGHQRVRAARVLEWTHIDCIVRHDLTADTAIDAFFVEESLCRRQLDVLGQARCYVELRRLENLNQPRRGARSGAERQDLRDRLARRFHCSGRQLDRYARLLDLPRAVQVAVSTGQLPVSGAERLFLLDHDQRDQVAAAIDSGECPKR
jgi:ParB-like chromosome segregation protein Spo0J